MGRRGGARTRASTPARYGRHGGRPLQRHRGRPLHLREGRPVQGRLGRRPRFNSLLATRYSLLICALALHVPVRADSPFAARVVEFAPAPGQFVNNSFYNDPARALGAPVGGGTVQPNNGKLVSLGGFGGTITLAFDHPVRDDAANPFGLDCIIFGNATWVGGLPTRRWAEAGVIEISKDVNGNGVADDPWYLIPGSHITSPAAQWSTQTWDDNIADATFPPGDAAWIPPGRSGVWTTAVYRLPSAVFDMSVLVHPAGDSAIDEIVWGYADVSPMMVLGDLDGDNVVDDPSVLAEVFYTRPDDPLRVGVTIGSSGGDAFDIAWAIDAATGTPANLDGFDFIRITNGSNVVLPLLGEKSPEIGGAADVAAGRLGDAENDGGIGWSDYEYLAGCLHGPNVAAPTCPCRVMDFDQDHDVDLSDTAALQLVFGSGATP
jgi:hypothetical protein